MQDSKSFLDFLIEKAKKEHNEKALNILNGKDILKKLEKNIEFFNSVGFDLINSNEEIVDNDKKIFLEITKALLQSYFTVYYVNADTGYYIGYSSSIGYKTLKIEEKGEDFFHDILLNIPKVVQKEDQEKIIKALEKNNLIEETLDGKSLLISYHLMLDEVPTNVTLKAMRMGNDSNIIIGVSNMDDAQKKELEYKKTIQRNVTYTNIALALAKSFFHIYYVDTSTNEYAEYNLNNDAQHLEKVDSGKNFFKECISQVKRALVKEDQEKFLKAINKETLIEELRKKNSFSLTYRQLLLGIPTYVQLNAVNLFNDLNHIIIAVSNIDEQKRQEEEYAKNLAQEKLLARTDALTGAANKHSYIEFENLLNDKIEKHDLIDFSIMLCDINDLKLINDSKGHLEGDKCIVEAKNIISNIFKNSTVYRIGGDEFVLILEGSDFYKRDHLFKMIQESNAKNRKTGKVIIACGYADFNPLIDKSVTSVFRRADDKMYENKKSLKR